MEPLKEINDIQKAKHFAMETIGTISSSENEDNAPILFSPVAPWMKYRATADRDHLHQGGNGVDVSGTMSEGCLVLFYTRDFGNDPDWGTIRSWFAGAVNLTGLRSAYDVARHDAPVLISTSFGEFLKEVERDEALMSVSFHTVDLAPIRNAWSPTAHHYALDVEPHRGSWCSASPLSHFSFSGTGLTYMPQRKVPFGLCSFWRVFKGELVACVTGGPGERKTKNCNVFTTSVHLCPGFDTSSCSND